MTRAVAGDRAGEVTLQIPVKLGLFPIYGHAHVADDVEPGRGPNRVRRLATPMVRVDDQAGEGDPVTFLKIDVEGFEPGVLAGAERTIERWRPSLLLEIEDRHLQRYGDDANEFADRIRSRWRDYRMYTWDGRAWRPAAAVDLSTRNYLFATDAAFERVRQAGRPGSHRVTS